MVIRQLINRFDRLTGRQTSVVMLWLFFVISWMRTIKSCSCVLMWVNILGDLFLLVFPFLFFVVSFSAFLLTLDFFRLEDSARVSRSSSDRSGSFALVFLLLVVDRWELGKGFSVSSFDVSRWCLSGLDFFLLLVFCFLSLVEVLSFSSSVESAARSIDLDCFRLRVFRLCSAGFSMDGFAVVARSARSFVALRVFRALTTTDFGFVLVVPRTRDFAVSLATDWTVVPRNEHRPPSDEQINSVQRLLVPWFEDAGGGSW